MRFTAYSSLGFDMKFPQNSLPDDRNIAGFCRDVFKGLAELDDVINERLQKTKNLMGKIKLKSFSLWNHLKQQRMDIANRYNARF